MQWYLEVLKKYTVFDGRAHRTEFWMFVVWSVVISLVLTIVDIVIGTYGEYGGLISGIYSLAIFIPSLAVGSRRLHDIGRSGWWQLLGIIPIIGTIIVIVWWAKAGDAAPNEYGRNPWDGPQPV